MITYKRGIELFRILCKITDSFLWIPKSMRRISSLIYIHNIITSKIMESQKSSLNFVGQYNCIRSVG